jgi:hypothetical protein
MSLTLKPVKSGVKVLMLCLLAASVLSPVLLTGVKAQGSEVTVGYWPLSQVQPSGYTVITPDSTGVNPGLLGGSPQPTLVDGEFGKAMQFSGNNFVYIPIKFIVGFPPSPQPIYVPVSPNLDVQKYIQIEAWINVPALKNVTYNNIVVKCTHPNELFSSLTSEATYWNDTTRIVGLAIRGTYLRDEGNQVAGALSGFVSTDTGGFNEIVTTQPIALNQWINVEFTRTSTGMHLYVNGYEQSVNVIHGVQNPQGNIVNGTEYYFGHDGFATIQDVSITDLDPPKVAEAAFDIGPNIMITVIVAAVILAIAWVMRRLIQLWLIRPKL